MSEHRWDMSNDIADPSRRKQRLLNLTSPNPSWRLIWQTSFSTVKPSCYILLSVGEIEWYNQVFLSRVAAPRIESIRLKLTTFHTVEHILHPARFVLVPDDGPQFITDSNLTRSRKLLVQVRHNASEMVEVPTDMTTE